MLRRSGLTHFGTEVLGVIVQPRNLRTLAPRDLQHINPAGSAVAPNLVHSQCEPNAPRQRPCRSTLDGKTLWAVDGGDTRNPYLSTPCNFLVSTW